MAQVVMEAERSDLQSANGDKQGTHGILLAQQT